jgi:lysophospholipase L1-like esterase
LSATAGTAARAADRCAIAEPLTAAPSALPRTVAQATSSHKLTIVALGSSSTAGTGASAPDRTYPARLATRLEGALPHVKIAIHNKGAGGEEAPAMVARLDRDVLALKPDLVIWQVGSNAVLHEDGVARFRAPIADGIARIRAGGADLIVMDVQYAPALLRDPDLPVMQAMLAELADAAGATLFPRFAIMRGWIDRGQMTMQAMIAPDGLHMTDLSYDCLAEQLGRLIVSPLPRALVSR